LNTRWQDGLAGLGARSASGKTTSDVTQASPMTSQTTIIRGLGRDASYGQKKFLVGRIFRPAKPSQLGNIYAKRNIGLLGKRKCEMAKRLFRSTRLTIAFNFKIYLIE
jgi:hypothetical protein